VPTLDLGVLVSGNGTNLQAILDAVAEGSLNARVRVVISNRADAHALERARSAGVSAVCIPHRDHGTRESFDAALVARLREAGASFIVLAGFMRVLTPVFLDAFAGKILNIHPALLPAFPGVDAIGQAIAYGVKVTGCTVHFVDAGVDTGPIVMQRAVPVHEGDTAQTLAARVHEQEHSALVEVLRWVADGRVHVEQRVDGGRVRATVSAPKP
jgi:phosphoribosylglycinamide formyltransferase 1